MRVTPITREYWKTKQQYEEQGLEIPPAITHIYETRMFLSHTLRTLDDYASGNAIPKAGWQWIDNLRHKPIPEDLPESPKQDVEQATGLILSMANELRQAPERYLVNNYTVTKEGRQRIRQAWLEISMILRKQRK